MSWRFRKTFRVLPGVKLNLTSRGLSATLGASPFSVNVGPRGVYRNISIPGTGIWDRQRIGGPSSQPSGVQPPAVDHAGGPTVPFAPVPVDGGETEIHSASTELLTSESLEHLRQLLTDAYNEREELTREISTATHEANTATRRFQNWERGFLMKRLFKQSFATRKETAETAVAKLEELQEQLRLTTIATEITVDREQAEPYYRMRDTFSALSECQKVWNVLAEKAIDRIAERSSADTAITRTAVRFSLNTCDLMQWEQKVPHLPNRTGGDMYIYPGFILYRASKQAFALIDSRDVTLRFVSTQFTETDPVPPDSHIVGRTWAKCNKDGSPDRRFRDNYQIPVAHYGTLLFMSFDGLDVRYVCSNARSAEEFAKAWTAFQMSFNGGPQKTDNAPSEAVPDHLMKAGERMKTAYETFMPSHQKFSEAISAVAREHKGDQTCKLMISREDFTAYTATVVELIAAAKDFEESDAYVSSSARGKLRRAIHNLETSWTTFSSVSDGRINDDGLMPFFNATEEFLNAWTEFLDAGSAALDKKAEFFDARSAAVEKGIKRLERHFNSNSARP
jgi:hypothetical protein